MKKHPTAVLSREQKDDILERLEHIALDGCSLKAWVDREYRETVEQIIERVDVLKLQIEALT